MQRVQIQARSLHKLIISEDFNKQFVFISHLNVTVLFQFYSQCQTAILALRLQYQLIEYSKMKFHAMFQRIAIKTIILLFFINEAESQIIATLDSAEIYIFPEATLHTDQYYSQTFPADSLTFATFTPSSIWTLSNNNTVQILDKNDLSEEYKNITEQSSTFQLQRTQPLSMIVFDKDYSKMAITGFINSQLVFYFYQFINSSIPSFQYQFSVEVNFTAAPATSFISDSTLYSFFSLTNQNDTIFGVSTINNSTVTITLPTSLASLAVSPNRKYALVWTEYSAVYIYAIPNFTLLYIYNGSVTNKKGTTDAITFSTDSTLALIQTDNKNPINILNLTSFTVVQSIAAHSKIISANFLDIDNRFVFVDFSTKAQIYDMMSNNMWLFNNSIQADQIYVDQNSSQLLIALGSSRDLMGINITINGTVIYGHYFAHSSSSNQSNSANSTSFMYLLNLSQAQNQTFAGLQSASAVVLQVMTSFNLVVFSSPFVCFFLGFFNYFTLNSLYILLNIQLPDIIFKELSSLFANANANLLTSLGVSFSPSPFTNELVDSPRGLYFGVSSDMSSSNYYPFGLVLLNSLLLELLLAIRRRLPRAHIAYSLLNFSRRKIYFGLTVYLMAGLVLPSQFVMTKRLSDLPTLTNAAVQCLLYAIIAQFLWGSLVEALRDSRKKRGNGQGKLERRDELPEWMIAFQNMLYPLLVLLPSPSFFLAVILFSKLTEIAVFVKHSRERGVSRILQMGSLQCEVVYHCTFIIFSLTHRQELIIYNSLICLLFFYLGALLNLAWTVLCFIKIFIKIVRAKKRNNKVVDNVPCHQQKYHIRLKKIAISNVLYCQQSEVVEKKNDLRTTVHQLNHRKVRVPARRIENNNKNNRKIILTRVY